MSEDYSKDFSVTYSSELKLNEMSSYENSSSIEKRRNDKAKRKYIKKLNSSSLNENEGSSEQTYCTPNSKDAANGRWTAEEHNRFMKALNLYGKSWKKVEDYIGTRTASQARSHAQKYFGKYFELVTRGDVYTSCSPAVQYMNSAKIYQNDEDKQVGKKRNQYQGKPNAIDSTQYQTTRTIQVIPKGKEFYDIGAIEQINVQQYTIDDIKELDKAQIACKKLFRSPNPLINSSKLIKTIDPILGYGLQNFNQFQTPNPKATQSNLQDLVEYETIHQQFISYGTNSSAIFKVEKARQNSSCSNLTAITRGISEQSSLSKTPQCLKSLSYDEDDIKNLLTKTATDSIRTKIRKNSNDFSVCSFYPQQSQQEYKGIQQPKGADDADIFFSNFFTCTSTSKTEQDIDERDYMNNTKENRSFNDERRVNNSTSQSSNNNISSEKHIFNEESFDMTPIVQQKQQFNEPKKPLTKTYQNTNTHTTANTNTITNTNTNTFARNLFNGSNNINNNVQQNKIQQKQQHYKVPSTQDSMTSKRFCFQNVSPQVQLRPSYDPLKGLKDLSYINYDPNQPIKIPTYSYGTLSCASQSLVLLSPYIQTQVEMVKSQQALILNEANLHQLNCQNIMTQQQTQPSLDDWVSFQQEQEFYQNHHNQGANFILDDIYQYNNGISNNNNNLLSQNQASSFISFK